MPALGELHEDLDREGLHELEDDADLRGRRGKITTIPQCNMLYYNIVQDSIL